MINESYHLWYGVREDYPICCIDFFINSWLNGIIQDEWHRDEGFIQCPECILDNFKHLVKYNH